MSCNRLRKSVIAAALGAGLMAAQIAGAQTSPGAERAARTGDERPLLRQPSDRSMQQSGAPNADDARATPGNDVRAPRNGTTRSDRDRSRAYTEPRSGAAPGSAEMRPDGPDAGVAKSGVKP
jgi:hypothetical protein